MHISKLGDDSSDLTLYPPAIQGTDISSFGFTDQSIVSLAVHEFLFSACVF
jgi:hypothetical protein